MWIAEAAPPPVLIEAIANMLRRPSMFRPDVIAAALEQADRKALAKRIGQAAVAMALKTYGATRSL